MSIHSFFLALRIATLLLLYGCEPIQAVPIAPGMPTDAGIPLEEVRPVANAGRDRRIMRWVDVWLDGRGSSDPNDDALTYSWTLSGPPGSNAALDDPTVVQPSFVPDLRGIYVASLTVSDGQHVSASDSVTLIVNNRPIVELDAVAIGVEGAPVVLQGVGIDEDGDPLTFSWDFVRRPFGSTSSLLGADSPAPSFVPDVKGEYELSLIVSDGIDTSPVIHTLVTVHMAGRQLAHRVIDAEYSQALDRIVMVDESPHTLYIYDPVAFTESTVALPVAPTSVSIGPDGYFAVVGHNGFISYINLVTATRVNTWPVACNVEDVVLADNGFAYAFPCSTSWGMHSLNLSTGAVMENEGIVTGGAGARLHPSRTRLYDIGGYHYNIASNGTVELAWRTFTTYMCGDLWFSEDGARIFTACGEVYRSSELRNQDMLYAGALSGNLKIAHLGHSATAGRIALVAKPWSLDDPPDIAMQLHFYSTDFLYPEPVVMLPPVVYSGRSYKGYGRFVFFNSAGDKVFVLMQAEPDANMLNDFSVVTY